MTENVYNVHQYDEEKRRALGIWTAELDKSSIKLESATMS